MLDLKDKSQSYRDNIIKCGIKLIFEKGVSNLTVQSIVDEANISKGGFYYHFKSKNHFIYELLFHENELERNFNLIISKHKGINSLIFFVEYIAKFINKINPDYFTILLPYILKEHYESIKDGSKSNISIFNYYKTIFNSAILDKTISTTLNVNELTNIFFSSSLGLVYSWSFQNDLLNLETEAYKFTNIFLAGIKYNLN